MKCGHETIANATIALFEYSVDSEQCKANQQPKCHNPATQVATAFAFGTLQDHRTGLDGFYNTP